MNLLFLTLADIRSLEERGIYLDLMRTFLQHGHQVFIVSPTEKREQKKTFQIEEGGCHLLKVRTGNLFRVGMLEKGISQVCLGRQYLRAIQAAWGDVSFDLILYSTPPIFLASAVKRLKRKTGAKTYLMLKDIFPQNAVDIGLMNPWMAKLLFRREEKKLYQISDKIGCMSPANARYLLRHNQIARRKVEVCPNSILPDDFEEMKKQKQTCRQNLCDKYGIDRKKVLFLYGGNLGKPQGIPFLVKCLEAGKNFPWLHFVVCGTGTEEKLLKQYGKKNSSCCTYIPGLPREEYEELVNGCDVGMIFLDYQFTIPNFPSRLLSYLEKGLPVLCCTDSATDLGKIAEKKGFGKACKSTRVKYFSALLPFFQEEKERQRMGIAARKYLEEQNTTEQSYQIIMKLFSR